MANLGLVRPSSLRNAIVGRFWPSLLTAPSSDTATEPLSPPSPAGSPSGVRANAKIASAPRPVLPWRQIVLQAAALWLVTRVAFVIVTYFAVLLTTRSPATGSVPVGPHAMLNAWNRWDAIWYTNIAHLGYWKDQATAFFPLYPLLIKGATLILGEHWLIVAMLVSNLGTLAAFIGLALWAAQEDFAPASGVAIVRMVAAYPLSLFLFAAYSDGIFLALVAFTFFFLRRADWRWAIVCGVLAGLARPTGVALMLPMLWEYGRQHGWWERARWSREKRRARPGLRELGLGALIVGAVPVGFALYEAFIVWRFHHPKLILVVERIYWHHTAMTPVQSVWEVMRQFFSTPPWTYWQAHQLLDIVPTVVFAVLTVALARRMPLAYTLYMAGLVLLAITSPITEGYPDLLMSAGRYMLAAAPLFLQLGRWSQRFPTLDTLLVSGGFLLQGVLTVVLLSGGWLI